MSDGNREPLSYYEALAAASGRMLRAAQASDWDALIEHEKECAGMIEALRAADAGSRLDAAGRLRKGSLIRQVLAEDAEIRRLTQPWLRALEDMLRASTNRARLGDHYR